jgi:HK97 gp10 family phage protein
VNITISVSGMDAFNSNLAQVIADKIRQTDEAVQEAGINTEAGAKQACPVDTGRLRSSIQYQNTGPAECQVGTPVEYAAFVELGTSRQSAQPYLFPAFASATTQLEDDLKAIWNS